MFLKSVELRREFAAFLAVLILAAAAYAPSLGAPFVYDDHEYIVHNGFIKHLSHLPLLFSGKDYFAGTQKPRFRPVSAAWYFLGYRIWGLNPLGHRLLKILVHAINGYLVFLLARLLSGRRLVAVLAALFFILHPAHTEAVNCIAFNDDILACGFVLTALIGARIYGSSGAPAAAALSIVAYLLGLLSKEIALLFIPALALQEMCFPPAAPRNNFRLVKIAPALAGVFFVTVAYLAARFWFFRGPALVAVTPEGLGERMELAARVVLEYFRLMLFPLRLSLDYSLPLFTLAFRAPPFWIMLFLATLAALALRAAVLSRPALWAIGWPVLFLLPVIHLLPAPQVLAERYLYLPLVGWGVALALMVVGIGSGETSRSGGSKPGERDLVPLRTVLLSLPVIAFFLFLTVRRNAEWRDEPTLWKLTLAVSPRSPVAHTNLGWHYYLRGEWKAAEREYRQALSARPLPRVAAVARANLAVLHERRKEYQDSLRELKQALVDYPEYARAQRQEGHVYFLTRRYRQAADKYLEALKLDPYDYETHILLGILLSTMGRPDEAERFFRKARWLNPDIKK